MGQFIPGLVLLCITFIIMVAHRKHGMRHRAPGTGSEGNSEPRTEP